MAKNKDMCLIIIDNTRDLKTLLSCEFISPKLK